MLRTLILARRYSKLSKLVLWLLVSVCTINITYYRNETKQKITLWSIRHNCWLPGILHFCAVNFIETRGFLLSTLDVLCSFI